MKQKPPGTIDPIERDIEQALSPGKFVGDRDCFSFVSGLERVAEKIRKLPAGSAPSIALYEIFLAGCYAKADELDDSSGSLGQFVEDLICSWIRARQASGADPNETAAMLLARMDDDPYGFCYQIEQQAAKVFDRAGLAAFERQVRERFEAAGEQPEYPRRHWGDVLRTLYVIQRNIPAYIALADQTGLTAQDCQALATLLVARRKPEEALAWVERGIALARDNPQMFMSGYDLAKLQRELWTKLGRANDALDAAWAEFRKHPSTSTYDELMKFVPAAERSTWREKAMDAASGSDLRSIIGLLLKTKEIQRLAELVRGATDDVLQAVSHYATESAAKKLEKAHPDLAARLWRAQGFRIVDAGKSKYYDQALSNFERAKRCFERAGLAAAWDETARRVRVSHSRKTGFLSGFEALATGSRPKNPPSFLERAKARWGVRYGKGGL